MFEDEIINAHVENHTTKREVWGGKFGGIAYNIHKGIVTYSNIIYFWLAMVVMGDGGGGDKVTTGTLHIWGFIR